MTRTYKKKWEIDRFEPLEVILRWRKDVRRRVRLDRPAESLILLNTPRGSTLSIGFPTTDGAVSYVTYDVEMLESVPNG